MVMDITAIAIETGAEAIIAGGSGGVGFSTATFLAREHQIRLVLIGSSASSNNQQALVQKLEAMGSQALYLQADLCDRAALSRAVTEAKQRFVYCVEIAGKRLCHAHISALRSVFGATVGD